MKCVRRKLLDNSREIDFTFVVTVVPLMTGDVARVDRHGLGEPSGSGGYGGGGGTKLRHGGASY